MHFWVYILRCSDGKYYTGHTDDLDKRLGQHQSGVGGDFTSRRLPVSLIWSRVLPSREEALAFELRVKAWSRAKKEALMLDDWKALSHFARPPSEGGYLDFARDERVLP